MASDDDNLSDEYIEPSDDDHFTEEDDYVSDEDDYISDDDIYGDLNMIVVRGMLKLITILS